MLVELKIRSEVSRYHRVVLGVAYVIGCSYLPMKHNERITPIKPIIRNIATVLLVKLR